MDEVHAEFPKAWAADHKMTGDRLNWPQGAWPYEGGGYWLTDSRDWAMPCTTMA
jgi:hypothetical protein